MAQPRQPVVITLEDSELDLELAMLRQSVERVNVERRRCHDCGRVPLVGEYVFEHRDGWTCELCHGVRGEHAREREQVRHAGGELTVRALRRSVLLG